MKRLIYRVLPAVVLAVALVGCRSNDASVSGRFVGLNSNMVYLEQISASGQNLIDSVALNNDGSYHLIIKDVAPTPSL